jgi:hypothetical protein
MAAWANAQRMAGFAVVPTPAGFVSGSPLAKLSALPLLAQARQGPGWVPGAPPSIPISGNWLTPPQAPTPQQILEGLKKIQDPVLAINLALLQLQAIDTRTPQGREFAAQLLELLISLLQQVEGEGRDATGTQPLDHATEKAFHHLTGQLRHAAEKMDPGYGRRAPHPREAQLDAVPDGTAAGQPGQVRWISQFSLPNGSVACYRASVAMAERAGAHPLASGARIQVGVDKDSAGAVTVNPQKAAEGRDYLDKEIASGRPVVVGVSHGGGQHNVDGLTDHFVTVTSRGVDAKGVYYTFNDPGTKDERRGSDTNPNNRLYVDAKTGKLYKPGARGHGQVTDLQYEVTMVRKNAERPN